MPEKKPAGLHIRDRMVRIKEIVAVDFVNARHTNIFHNHAEAWELMYCSAGHMAVKLRENWIDLDAGCCILIPAGVFHSSMIRDNDTRCFFIAFAPATDLSEISEYVIRLSKEQTVLYDALTAELTKGYLNTAPHNRVQTLIQNSELALGAEQLILNYLEMILVLMFRNRSERGKLAAPQPHEEYIEDFSSDYITESVTRFLRDHVTEPLTVESVASHFGYSRSRLSTIYKKNTGTSLNKAISREKMLRARQLLIDSDLSITEISELLSFSSPQYFTNKFNRLTGMSPSNYAHFKRTKID